MNEKKLASKTRQVAAAVIGNALEWYDFTVFGFMTGIIASVFFSSDSAYGSLLLTAATFGVGFVMRPIGGILIGYYADRGGRKAALQLVIALMTVATAIIAFAPSYASIGVASSITIVVARMLQGLAAGGEFASSTALLIEMAPENKRGLYGSWQMVGQALSLLSGAVSGTLIVRYTSHEQLVSWGWRLPFIFGLLIAPVGYWIRNNLREPEQYLNVRSKQTREMSMGVALRTYGRSIAASMLLTAAATIPSYVLIIYMPTYASKFINIPLEAAFSSQCVAILALTVLTPLSGALSDRVGRRPLIQFSLIFYAIALLPIFNWFLETGSVFRLTVMQVVLCSAVGVYFGPYAAAVGELFPVKIRSTGMAVSYNISVMVFGGFAPMIITWLLTSTGSKLTPAFYLTFGAALGIAGALLLPKPELAAKTSEVC
jgi:MFS transporter, MHS family, proline/betaine transporter